MSEGVLELRKVNGTENIADALTKFLEKEGISKHMYATQQEIRHLRHALIPTRSSS